MDVVSLVRQLLVGISSGMITFVGAAGVSLVVSGMNLLNFAQGAFMMLGAYLAYSVVPLVGFWWALLVAPLGVAVVGGIVEILLRPLYSKNMLYQLILTMGIAFIMIDSIQWIWGPFIKTVKTPVLFSTPSISLLGSKFPVYYFVIIVIAGLFAIGLWLMFDKTKLGMTFRAIISNRPMVENLGINVTFLFSIMFMLGVWMSGVAGVLISPIIGIFPQKAMDILFSIMTVIIIGGLTSMRGAFFAAIIVGLALSIGSLYLSWFYSLLPGLLMIIVLLIRPQGLFASSANK
jgi:branched-chain amino acid transport system permease protein